MTLTTAHPRLDDLDGIVRTLAGWQRDDVPLQLHPGDLGWAWRLGAQPMADAIRAWRSDGAVVGIGFLDGPEVLRLAVAPDLQQDLPLARALVLSLGAMTVGSVEVPTGAILRELLHDAGWTDGESWTPLQRDLAEPVPDPGLRVEVVAPDDIDVRVELQRASFDRSRFDAAQWRAMADGPAYVDARCLVGYDDADAPVAAATVWSAGPGRPGLLEPVGTHRDHLHRGHGRAISLAAAATLRGLGSSSAQVCTPSANVPAVATYRAAGFTALPVRLDLVRPAG